MSTLDFSQVLTISILKGAFSSAINLDANTAWKIESAGIGGTNGSVFLLDTSLPAGPPDQQQVAMLFSSVNEHNYGSPLPFWIMPGFQGKIWNNSNFSAIISITIYAYMP